MSLTRRAFAATERRSEWGDSTPPPPGGGMLSGATSEMRALQVLAVYGSVDIIAKAIASLPWQRFSTSDPATRRELPLTQILKKPYVEIRRTDWLIQYVTSMALRGNFYGQVLERDQDFFPTQIKPIHPDRATVRRLPSGLPEYRFNSKVVPTDNVFHIRNLSVAGALEGLNPIEHIRLALLLASSADQYGAEFFTNSAFPGGTITVEDDLEPDEALKMARAWTATHGPGKRHMPAVVTGGGKFEAVTINPADSQFLETRQYSASAISGMIFHVPPHKLGMTEKSTSWGKGIEQQERGFVTDTLGGYIGALEEAVDELHPDEQYCQLNLSARLRGDSLQRAQVGALGTAGGWLCADDVRAIEGLPPLPNGTGQNFMVPINSELLAQALQSVKDSEAAAQADANGQEGGTDG